MGDAGSKKTLGDHAIDSDAGTIRLPGARLESLESAAMQNQTKCLSMGVPSGSQHTISQMGHYSPRLVSCF